MQYMLPKANVAMKLSSETIASFVFAVIFFILALNAATFTYINTSLEVRSDGWRHLNDVVLPFVNGESDFYVLWSNHHAFPFLHMLQIASLKIFDLRTDVIAFFGMSCQVLFAFLISYRLRVTLKQLDKAAL